RPGLTGIKVAAPVLFETFGLLGESSWYEAPHDELYAVEVCQSSGYRLGNNCLRADTVLIGQSGKSAAICSYHLRVQLNQEKTKRVNSSCYSVADMRDTSFLVLPPLMEWYYRKKEPTYQ